MAAPPCNTDNGPSEKATLADLTSNCKPMGKVAHLPNEQVVTVLNTDTSQISKHRVRGLIACDGLITGILVYFYGARLSFEWEQSTHSYKLGTNLVVIG